MKKLFLFILIALLCSCSSNMESFDSSLNKDFTYKPFNAKLVKPTDSFFETADSASESFDYTIDEIKFSWEKFVNSFEHDQRSILDIIFEPLKYESINNEHVFYFK